MMLNRCAWILMALLVAPQPALADEAQWDASPRALKGYLSLCGAVGYRSERTGESYGTYWRPAAGVSAGAWGVISKHVHIGGYLGYRFESARLVLNFGSSEDPVGTFDVHSMTLGGSVRFGGPVSPTTWIGISLDAGGLIFNEMSDGNPSWGEISAMKIGFAFFPQVVVLFAHPTGPFAFGLEASVGLELSDYGIDRCYEGECGGGSHRSWAPMARLGFLFGGR